jgi:hypothetical protein
MANCRLTEETFGGKTKMSKRGKSNKLSPVEGLVVVLVCLFFLALVVPASQMGRSDAFRIECAENLSRIARAMLIYANDYDDAFPRSGGRNSQWTSKIPNWLAANRFYAFGLSANGSGGRATISSCFYLLVKYTEAHPESFVCPGDV